MPTPFMHLNMAHKMISRPELSPAATDLINQHWPAFCLGNIAADFQQLCDIRRSTTHFYSTPPDFGDHQAFDRMLAEYSAFAKPEMLTVDHAVFLAGYGAHLIYDLVWFHNIVRVFVYGEWGDKKSRFVAHNSLLAHEDHSSLKRLPERLGDVVSDIDPAGWLPFDPDDCLVTWQKLVADQLMPGAEVQTLKIFSGRMGLTADEFGARLTDPTWLQAEIFDHVPQTLISDVLETSISMSIDQTQAYLEPILS
ncbi:MAG: zinc dependent phospholipase C family protein [Anaerolineae bacterium]